MSRDISDNVLSAIQDSYGSKIRVKAFVDPSRTFFGSLSDDYPYDAVDYSTPTDTPTGQAAIYDSNAGDMFTFVVDPSTGSIYGMQRGSATKNDLSLTADADTKPAVESLGNGSVYLYYWDGSNLKRSTVNLSTWAVSGTTTITINYIPSAWTISGGSPHVLSEGRLAFTYQTSLGGIACAYYDGDNWIHWKGRFLSPNTKTAKDWSIYSTATILDNKIFFYMTDMATGEVRGVEYNFYSDSWSDSFISLPADLSRFNIANSILANGYVHISGQFHRTGDLANAEVYSLVLRSKDGKTFSWDRFTLLSTEGFLFNISADNSNKIIWASDRNSVGYANMSYFFHPTPPDRITLQPPNDIVSFSLRGSNNATMNIAAAKETYLDNKVIKKGSRVIIYLGYEYGNQIEYTKYAQFIINNLSDGFSQGQKNMSVDLVDEGIWKTTEIAFPFYAEILSKVTSHDDCDERDKMYPVQTIRPTSPDYLYLDFWSNNYWDGDSSVSGVEFRFRGTGNGCSRMQLTNYQGATDQQLVKTANLNEHPFLTDYPTLDSTSINVKLTGWEMASTAGRPNSTWVVYAITAPTDDLEDKTVTQGTLASTYAKFPQQYFSTESGSDPIEWNITGLTSGDALLYLGFAIQNTDASDGYSWIDPGHLRITNLDFSYVNDSTSTGWKVTTPSGETRSYLELPKSGVPSVMFLSKPYTAYNFQISAEFIYAAGSDPLSDGTVAWGVVGLAADGKNLIVARYNKLKNYVELVVLRNGFETRLTTYTPSSQPEDIMLQHRDGRFFVLVRETGTTWTGPVITYYWDEVTNDVISTSSTGIMHIGIYGAVSPPSFITPSFNVLNSKGIAVGPFQDEASALAGFPNSGYVVVDGIKYSYTGKTTGSAYYGPYQGRQSESYKGYSEGGNSYSGWATEIALYLPSSSSTHVSDLLFSSDNGYTMIVNNSDWTVIHYTAGQPNYLRNRSRHYAEEHPGDVIGTNNRVFICPGLLEPVQEDDNKSYIHGFGSLVSLYGSDQMWAKKVVGTTLNSDTSVSDMLKYVCATASVETEFNGDWTKDSETVGTSAVQLAPNEELLPGGFDVTFTLPPLSSTHWVALYASNLFLNTTETIQFGFKNVSGLLEVYSDPSGSSATETIQTGISASKSRVCRVFFHDEFASIYVDGKSVATFAYSSEDLTWPNTQVNLYLQASTDSYTISGIRVVELFDWREAIYVESEITASSALGSVIQERPIEILTNQEGQLSFSYNLVRDEVDCPLDKSIKVIAKHTRKQATSRDAGSDAIVYYTDIAFVSDLVFAQTEGFITRVLKLASIEAGADIAGKLILRKSREQQTSHNLIMRPDIRLVPGDIYNFAYRLNDTKRIMSYSIIVEDISIELIEGQYTMTITGRQNTEQPGLSTITAYLEGTS